jgi:hypothetical protein
MAETKTKPTGASVEDHLASRATPEQLADCRTLIAMCERITGEPATMWGPSIVGHGRYTYRYASGHGGDAALVGFAVRGRELVIYVLVESDAQRARLARLGRHRMGKSCLHFRRLADLDLDVFEALVAESVADIRRRHPDGEA